MYYVHLPSAQLDDFCDPPAVYLGTYSYLDRMGGRGVVMLPCKSALDQAVGARIKENEPHSRAVLSLKCIYILPK
jgi:hypothetical protein